jgi:hypothetical protein
MTDEMHDPEMSYRRGYHQGAQQVLDAIKHFLPVRQSSIVHAWIAEDLGKWRVAALKGESKREHNGSTVMCQPPTKRLSSISGQTST